MLSVLEKVFKEKVATQAWQQKIRQIVPSYGTKLNDSADRVRQEWAYTSEVLQLAPPPSMTAPAPAGQQGSMRPTKSDAAADMAL